MSQVLRETTGTNNTWYWRGLGTIGQRRETPDTVSDYTYFGTDGLGSVRFTTGEDGGVTSSALYDPYGVPLPMVETTSATLTTRGFTGEETDATGLQFLRARYYSPELGTFTGLDPIEGVAGRVASRNGYGYVEGNPVNYRDPSGKFLFIPFLMAVVGGAFAGGFVYGAAKEAQRGGSLGDAIGQGVAWGGGAGLVMAAAFNPMAAVEGALWGALYGFARWDIAALGLGGVDNKKWARSTNPFAYAGANAIVGGVMGGAFGTVAATGQTARLAANSVGLGFSTMGAVSAGADIFKNGPNGVNLLDLGFALFGMRQSGKEIGKQIRFSSNFSKSSIGRGGVLPTESNPVPHPSMASQELTDSCVSACIRELLRRQGIIRSEAEVIELIGSDPETGLTTGFFENVQEGINTLSSLNYTLIIVFEVECPVDRRRITACKTQGL